MISLPGGGFSIIYARHERTKVPPRSTDARRRLRTSSSPSARTTTRAVTQLSDEEYELARYEERQKALRETAEARNADALAAAKAADEEAARLAAAEAEMESLRKECVGADSPLVEPGSVLCT